MHCREVPRMFLNGVWCGGVGVSGRRRTKGGRTDRPDRCARWHVALARGVAVFAGVFDESTERGGGEEQHDGDRVSDARHVCVCVCKLPRATW